MHHYAAEYYVWLENKLHRAATPTVVTWSKKKNFLLFNFKAPTPGGVFLFVYNDCAGHKISISVQV